MKDTWEWKVDCKDEVLKTANMLCAVSLQAGHWQYLELNNTGLSIANFNGHVNISF